jgi:hypothetical protein
VEIDDSSTFGHSVKRPLALKKKKEEEKNRKLSERRGLRIKKQLGRVD